MVKKAYLFHPKSGPKSCAPSVVMCLSVVSVAYLRYRLLSCYGYTHKMIEIQGVDTDEVMQSSFEWIAQRIGNNSSQFGGCILTTSTVVNRSSADVPELTTEALGRVHVLAVDSPMDLVVSIQRLHEYNPSYLVLAGLSHMFSQINDGDSRFELYLALLSQAYPSLHVIESENIPRFDRLRNYSSSLQY